MNLMTSRTLPTPESGSLIQGILMCTPGRPHRSGYFPAGPGFELMHSVISKQKVVSCARSLGLHFLCDILPAPPNNYLYTEREHPWKTFGEVVETESYLSWTYENRY